MSAENVARKVRALIGELVDLGKYELRLTMPSGPHPSTRGRSARGRFVSRATVMQIATWFNGGTEHQPPREFLKVKGRAREAAVRAVIARMKANMREGRGLGVLPSLTIGGNAMREVFVDRLQLNGADVRFAPLSPKYLARKVRMGLDPRTGIATGVMLRAFQSARINIVRTR